MALLNFPFPATNGQLYPATPLPGENQYQYDGPNQTWRLLGTATGVVPGTYGDSLNVGKFTVDATGRITFAQNVAIASSGIGTVTSVDVSSGTTGLTSSGGPVTTSGVITLDGVLNVAHGGTGAVTANDALNALLPDQTVATPGSFLYTDGVNSGWVDPLLYFVSYVTPPTASTDSGALGQIAVDANFFYWFDGALWQRVAKDATPW